MIAGKATSIFNTKNYCLPGTQEYNLPFLSSASHPVANRNVLNVLVAGAAVRVYQETDRKDELFRLRPSNESRPQLLLFFPFFCTATWTRTTGGGGDDAVTGSGC